MVTLRRDYRCYVGQISLSLARCLFTHLYLTAIRIYNVLEYCYLFPCKLSYHYQMEHEAGNLDHGSWGIGELPHLEESFFKIASQ